MFKEFMGTFLLYATTYLVTPTIISGLFAWGQDEDFEEFIPRWLFTLVINGVFMTIYFKSIGNF